MPQNKGMSRRDPANVQAWLVGGGIGSLAAAVHLINDANVPASNIHVLDMHKGPGGAMQSSGDPEKGYSLGTTCLPFTHDVCVEELLSHVPSTTNPDRSVMAVVRDMERKEKEQGVPSASTRFLVHGKSGPERVDHRQFSLGFKQRFEVIRLMVEGEKAVADKAIKDLFDASFFNTKFWNLWSTTFALRPEHGAVEFQRRLRKYLERVKDFNNVSALDRTQHTLHHSVVLPMASYLKEQGVDFRFDAPVVDLVMYPDGDPTTVSAIRLEHNGKPTALTTMDPMDIVIVTLGSVSSASVVGSNNEAPPAQGNYEDITNHDWFLWKMLNTKSNKFGDPSTYISGTEDSKVETFTVTLRDSKFLELFEKLTHDRPGSGALVSIPDSNWMLSLSVPHQPLFPDQPANVQVVWGYGLYHNKPGNYVQKPMLDCTGEEILTEVLGHLNIPQDEILPTAITIPCVTPLGTAAMLKRSQHNRPEVIPHNTTNLAFVGQFAEIPHDTSFSMEYSVRGAQLAVYNLMGLDKRPPPVKNNVLLEVLGMLGS
ncbi:oleate hydratase [Aspergillus avenaceus]|uniref:Oleate hydratase n=1 Tax=Aspergillus avenaceus TaxID=36643 RepID=A0A5N6U5U2_ASPAV|nr:oleate hydratase [Aspergillus avenaceus]